MSASELVRVRYDLSSFAAEGGERHQNRDGWGIVFTDGRDAHYFREASPASESPLDRFVREHAEPHRNVLAHVRRASTGDRSLANTHPFRRVRHGRVHHFAHNGTLRAIESRSDAGALISERVGDTDSELAFLLLLERLDQYAPDASNVAARFEVFREFSRDMAALGPANMLWLDGDTLFAHADQRAYETPQGLSAPKPPGIHVLQPAPGELGASHECTGANLRDVPDHLVLLASLPLSEASWEPLDRGAVLAVSDGRILHRGSSA